MINLLSNQERDDIMYARRNTKLLHWVVGIIIIIVGMLLIVGGGYLYANSTIDKYTAEVNDRQTSLENQKLSESQQRIQTLSNNVKLILQVLGNEVLFSKLLRQVGAVMPQGSVLTSIEIGEVKGGLDLVASAKDYDTATQVQVNLASLDNQLFAKADIVSVACGGSDPTYPCTVTLRAEFDSNNPYLFLNQSKAGSND